MSDEGAGAPGWIMTFADLMSLLMTFFVLLLSFSEMDVLMYKQIAGSMSEAFGVQREIKVREIPKGTSIIAQNFSPGKPEPTVVNEIRQKTVDESRRELKIHESEVKPDSPEHSIKKGGTDQKGEMKMFGGDTTSSKNNKSKFMVDVKKIKGELKQEIKDGKVEVSVVDKKIVIRVKDKSAFSSGSAKVHKEFMPTIDKISKMLKTVRGEVHVSGHTDDVPIHTEEYKSNWDLSSKRAVAVISTIMKKNPEVDRGRFVANAFADSRPLVPNDSEANRSRNRRVEITIHQDDEAIKRAKERKVRQQLEKLAAEKAIAEKARQAAELEKDIPIPDPVLEGFSE